MPRIEAAVAWAERIARDNSHGYSQYNRWGPDYDCSSLVISALEQAGIPAKSKGATFTGNMPNVLISLGFHNVTRNVNLSTGAGLQRGDILWSQSHTGFYCGGGQLVHASIDENGTIVGKTPGDQTGKEICIRSYYNKPWTAIYRLTEEGASATMVTIQMPMIRKGNKGSAVWTLQTMLNAKGFDCGAVDSDFGSKTDHAVRNYQSVRGLEVDGIVGRATWSALLN